VWLLSFSARVRVTLRVGVRVTLRARVRVTLRVRVRVTLRVRVNVRFGWVRVRAKCDFRFKDIFM